MEPYAGCHVRLRNAVIAAIHVHFQRSHDSWKMIGADLVAVQGVWTSACGPACGLAAIEPNVEMGITSTVVGVIVGIGLEIKTVPTSHGCCESAVGTAIAATFLGHLPCPPATGLQVVELSPSIDTAKTVAIIPTTVAAAMKSWQVWLSVHDVAAAAHKIVGVACRSADLHLVSSCKMYASVVVSVT